MKRVSTFIIAFEVALFSIIIFLLFQMHLLDSTLYTSSQNKTKMLKIADELRQSSDDLTHFARSYSVTNNKLYYEQYWHTLGIRNGKIPRPLLYDGIYWDLKKDIREKHHPDTEKKSLKALIKELPFSMQEIDKLYLSEKNSNDLVNLEMKAFEAMKRTPPNQQYAIELLHSKDYYAAKHKIMYPIDEFMHMLNQRLHNEFDKIEQQVERNFILFVGMLFLFIITNIIVYKKMKKSLLNVIESEVEKNRLKDQQLIQQHRLVQMGEMISMIAHQWRQPLTVISMSSNNILLDIELNNINEDDLKNTVNHITSTSYELSQTIDDFSNFYKSNKQSVVIKLENVIKESLNIIKPSLIHNNINVIEEYNGNEEIELYDSEIRRVILNILKNAQDNFEVKQTQNKAIVIKTENRTISICNNGGKISESIIDKIFDPYFSTKDGKNGIGLSLYMSKMIIEEHHQGKITVKNTDCGVCFTIDLGKKVK